MSRIRIRPIGKRIEINLPSRPALQGTKEQETLMGMVQDKPASAPEERLARALDKADISFIFRYVVGAPKGLPGWKELDFVIEHGGIIYPLEVDTAFTHRNKAFADVLHDAIVLNDFELQTMGVVYPNVKHVDGDSDLASRANAEGFVKREFA